MPLPAPVMSAIFCMIVSLRTVGGAETERGQIDADAAGRHATPVSSCHDGRRSRHHLSLVFKGTSGGAAFSSHRHRTSPGTSHGTYRVAVRSPADGCRADRTWRSLRR